ncbi:MAG: NAD(P)-binding domain-containing protein, partial [candidate division Zixibacteria bacterium]|nr:NAD(P)-binding domain-containing protein [candidate division Zixibacteria bacterium]
MVRKLKRKKIAVLGYGSQGRSIALNLRDSGYDVTIGLPPKSQSRKKARADKFAAIFSVSDAVKQSTILCFAFPDHLQGKTYKNEIQANLNK